MTNPILLQAEPSPQHSAARFSSRAWLVMALLLVAVGAFHLATLREGVKLAGGDPALYIGHAKNLVEGRPYAETGYIQNPRFALHPQAYPPGYPLLLAPVYAVFGLNYTAMKVELVLFFVAALGVMALLFRHALPFPYLLAFVAAVGFNPFFWSWKNIIMSDLPFLFFCVASLLVYERAQATAARSTMRRMLAWSALAGVCACAAVLTRTIGVALIPAFLLHDLVHFRRPSRPLLVALLAGGLLFGAQRLALAPNSAPPTSTATATGAAAPKAGYARIVKQDLARRLRSAAQDVPEVAGRYVRFAAGMTWSNGVSRKVKQAFFLLFALPVGLGYGVRLVRRGSPVELFAACYVAALLPWSFSWSRYLLPVLPLYFFYLFAGLAWLEAWLGGRVRRPRGALLGFALVALGGSYAAEYATLDLRPVESPVESAAAREAFAAVERITRPGDVLVTGRPRMLTLFVDRGLVAPHRARDAALLDYFASVSADYVLTGPHDVERSAQLEALVERRPDAFELAFANGPFRLYRLGRPPRPAGVRNASPER